MLVFLDTEEPVQKTPVITKQRTQESVSNVSFKNIACASILEIEV